MIYLTYEDWEYLYELTYINMTLNIYNHFAKWFRNKSSWTSMTWWKSNFNMPVPDIYDDNTIYSKTEWMLDSIDEATSFDLTWFNYWWEAIAASSVFTVDWPYWWADIFISQEWRDTLWNIIFTNWPVLMETWVLLSWEWSSYQLWSNQWVAPWEISTSWIYTCRCIATWWYNQTVDFQVNITNVPLFYWYKDPWYIWVEWTQICYTSANWFLHKKTWVFDSNVWISSAWAIWIQWSSIRYIDQLWDMRIWETPIKQFWSIFSNWPTWSVSWQSPWYIYADNEFWWTHLSYIDSLWNKWLTWDWEYPY